MAGNKNSAANTKGISKKAATVTAATEQLDRLDRRS